MKRSQKFVLGMVIVIVILLLILVRRFDYKSSYSETDTDNNDVMVINNSKNDGAYYEDGVDYGYNYITNGDTLKKYDIAYKIIENLGNDANQLLTDAGVTNEALEIVAIKAEGTYVRFQLVPENGIKKTIYVECTKKTNEYTIYLKE